MDNNEREARDRNYVESFSQLPFLRPTAIKDKSSNGAIRLFGKEFNTSSIEVNQSDQVINGNNINGDDQKDKDHTVVGDNNNNNITDRKFECHYCCRNFPTSQALGGHQNAHKRERQNAKRAHLQPASMTPGGPEAHDYSLMSYNHRFGHSPTNTSLPIGYHSWNTRLYGNASPYSSNVAQPINGSPLSMWRVPSTSAHGSVYSRGERGYSVVQRPPQINTHNLLLDNTRDGIRLKALSGGAVSTRHENRLGYESKGDMQDHVSLDLHL